MIVVVILRFRVSTRAAKSTPGKRGQMVIVALRRKEKKFPIERQVNVVAIVVVAVEVVGGG